MDSNLECCVFGCHTRPNQGVAFYRFPCHNPQMSSIWEQRISKSASVDIDILNHHVCELHFDYRCKTGNECALEEGSLPTLHLPSLGTLFSTDNENFEMSANRIEPSYKISIDALSYHCRFCLRRGLLYELEASTYRSSQVLSDNAQPNACLSCLKSIVIAHQLSRAIEHSNTIVQLLLQHPKQSKVVSYNNFFDMKAELAFCNLILANALSIKLEIEIDDKLVSNEDYEQKWLVTGEPTSGTYASSQNMIEKFTCVTENQDNVSQMDESITSDKHCQRENTTDLRAEGIPNAYENPDFCVLVKNTHDNGEVSNNSNFSFAEDRQFNSEQVPESTNNVVIDPTWMTTFTTIDKNTHWNENDGSYICPTSEWKSQSPNSFNGHVGKHEQNDKDSAIGSQELATLKTDPVRNADGRYQCTECPKAFSYKSHFSRHKVIHTNEGPYKCTECPKTFSWKSNFDIHNRIHTHERPYKCTECSKTFIRKGTLDIHMRIHTNERPYECTECPKTFIEKNNLIQHMRIHTNEKPFQCTECSKTFRQKGQFVKHMRIHMNERPYKCTECPKTYSLKSYLDIHKRKHTNERPYKCTECAKTFSQKGHLDTHKRIHTNERPYKCTDCPKTFNQKGHFDRHKRIHTNEQPYKCSVCPEDFGYKCNSETHMINTHECKDVKMYGESEIFK